MEMLYGCQDESADSLKFKGIVLGCCFCVVCMCVYQLPVSSDVRFTSTCQQVCSAWVRCTVSKHFLVVCM